MNLNLATITSNQYYLRYKIILWPAVVGIICVVLLIFIIIPQIQNSFFTLRTLSDSEARLRNLDKKADLLERINTSEYRQNINTALIALPEEKDIPGVLSQILFLLGANQLKLVAIGLSPAPPSSSNLESVGLKLEVEGDTLGIKNFLTKLRAVPRLMKVTGLEVNGSRETIQATISLTAHYLGLVSQLGDIEKPIEEVSQAELEVLTTIKNNLRSTPSSLVITPTSTGKVDPFE